MIKYNSKYDLYVDDDLIIYYWDYKLDKLVQSKIHKNSCGYLMVHSKLKDTFVHRIIYETFNSEIPKGYEIDHINTIRTDNRLENLRCVTHTENNLNPLTRIHLSESMKGNNNARGVIKSSFGNKFKVHYGITKSDDIKLYDKEYKWYIRHNHKCSWE